MIVYIWYITPILPSYISILYYSMDILILLIGHPHSIYWWYALYSSLVWDIHTMGWIFIYTPPPTPPKQKT